MLSEYCLNGFIPFSNVPKTMLKKLLNINMYTNYSCNKVFRFHFGIGSVDL